MTTPIQNPKAKQINRSKVMKQAWNLKKTFSLPWKVALKWAWSIAKKGFSPVVKIEFVKACGEITERIGTALKLKGEYKNLLFWSLTDKGYKQAKIERILSICTHTD